MAETTCAMFLNLTRAADTLQTAQGAVHNIYSLFQSSLMQFELFAPDILFLESKMAEIPEAPVLSADELTWSLISYHLRSSTKASLTHAVYRTEYASINTD